MRSFPILLLTVVLLTTTSFAFADTITSTPAGGHWSLTSTWIGGVVPGTYDDVVIAGLVRVTGPESCQSLVVEPAGTLMGGFNGIDNTLKVSGPVTNQGLIDDSILWFYIEVGGDLHNAGTWTNRQIMVTGTADRYISHEPGYGFGTKIIYGPGAAGDMIATNPLEIIGDVIVTGGRLVLQEDCPFYLTQGVFKGELVAGGNEMHFISWSYLEQATLDDVVMVGEVEASFSVEFTTRVTVQDTLRNSSGGGGATIHGDLINNGLITNHQYGFAVFLYGDLENNGIIRNSQVELKGDGPHHISMSPDSEITANVFLPEFEARTLIADTPVHFGDGLFIGIGKMVLMPGSSLRFTQWGGMGAGVLEANGNDLSIDGSGSFNDMTIDQGVFVDQVTVYGDVQCTNGLTVNGTLTGWPWASADVTVEGLLINNGEIRNGDHPVWITAMNDVQNLGTFSNSKVVLAGVADQSVGAGPGIGTDLFIIESGLQAASYQWYRDGAPLPGQTSTNLLLPGVSSADYGNYHCVGDGLTSRTVLIAETLGVADVPGATNIAVLEQNSPNPFNPATEIAFSLDQTGSVSLNVYDLSGRLVAELANRDYPVGRHQITWQPRDLASGTYVYRLRTDHGVVSRKCLLLQ